VIGSKRFSLAVVSAALSWATSSGAASADELGTMWLARSEAASKHLAQPGLDVCDIALDKAFQHPREINSGSFRTFDLKVELDGQVLQASYSYKSGNLSSFNLISLPPKWFATQRASTKTLSILVGAANCAMDFCTNDPLAIGPCAGDTPE
jgi:hypothetical protein